MRLTFQPKSAMTLIELVITIALIGIVAISTFSAYAYISTYSVRANNYACATEFLCQTLEKLSSYKYSDTALSITDGNPPHNDDLPDCDLKNKYQGARTYTVGSNPEPRWDSGWTDTTYNGYKIITATMSWNDGVSRTLILTMRKTK